MFKIPFGRNLRDSKKAQFLQRENPPMTFEQIAEQLHIPDGFIHQSTDCLTSHEAARAAKQPPLCPGRVIAVALEENGFSQADMARILRVSKPQMSYLIHGQRPLSVEQADVIGRTLNIPPHVLLRLQADYSLYLYYTNPSTIPPTKLNEVE